MEAPMNCKNVTYLALLGICLMVLSGCNPSGDDTISQGDSSEPGGDLEIADVNEDNAGQVVIAFFEREGYFSGAYFHRARVAAERAVILTSRGDDEGPIPPLPDDYVRTESLSGENTLVRMSVDGEGNILPNRDWRIENSQYCLEQGKYLRTPMWQLQVEFHPETNEVFIRLLDVETGEIERMGSGRGDDDTWVDEAITEAWNQANIPEVERADSPCGDDIELTLVFESELTATTDASYSNTSTVASRVPLGPGSEPGVFTGSSLLLTTDYENSGPSHPYVDCSWSPIHGEMSAQVTIPDGNFDPDSSSNFYDNIDVNIRILAAQAPGVRHHCTVTTPDGSGQVTLEDRPWYPWFHVLNQSQTDRYRYFYSNLLWDSLDDDPFGLVERTIDQSETFTDEGDSLTLEDSTTLMIRTEIMPPL